MNAIGHRSVFDRLVQQTSSFVRTPKGRLLLYYGTFAVLAAVREDFVTVAIAVVATVGTAALVDVAFRRLLLGDWVAPSGAMLTGLVVAMVLNPYGSVLVPMAAAAVGVAAKHLIRTRTANVLNPAAFGIIVAATVMGRGQSWWGSLPAYDLLGALAVIGVGALTADHGNKIPLVLSFFATYFSLFAALTFAPDGGSVAEVFLAPGAHAALSFAFFMLDDPPTSPVRYVDQVWYGALVAALAVVVFVADGGAYYLVAALLIGNLVEAGRRIRQDRRRFVGREDTGSLAGLAG